MKIGKFQNKVVVVTGSGEGIGKNIARAFGKEGALVVVCGKDVEKGKYTTEEFKKEGIAVKRIAIDLGKKRAPQKMVQWVVKECGKIDILVNNARSGVRKLLIEETEESWEEGISVTLRAAFFTSQEAIRYMQKSGGGAIVNISSVAGEVVGHDSAVYHIAKAGMIQMTRYMAVHAGKFGVRVNCILPGFIIKDEYIKRFERADNEEFRETVKFLHPLGKTGGSDDVAKAVLFLSSSEASFITGQALHVDGGLTIQDQNNIVFRFKAMKR